MPEDILGLPQGGPRSGDLFCFFTSDLPEEIQQAGAGADLYFRRSSSLSPLMQQTTSSEQRHSEHCSTIYGRSDANCWD